MRIKDRLCRVYAAASFVRSQLSLAAMCIFTVVCMFLLGYLLDDTEENALTTKEKHWALVWHDEFNGTEVDLQKWSFEYNCYGGGNNEQQCYTDRKENAFIAEGLLHIVARQKPIIFLSLLLSIIASYRLINTYIINKKRLWKSTLVDTFIIHIFSPITTNSKI